MGEVEAQWSAITNFVETKEMTRLRVKSEAYKQIEQEIVDLRDAIVSPASYYLQMWINKDNIIFDQGFNFQLTNLCNFALMKYRTEPATNEEVDSCRDKLLRHL